MPSGQANFYLFNRIAGISRYNGKDSVFLEAVLVFGRGNRGEEFRSPSP